MRQTSRLESKITPEFKRTYTYDQFSRPQTTTTTIGTTSYTNTLVYDDASRVSRINYPGSNNFAVRNVYNAQGYLEQVQNANDAGLVYWRA